MPHFNAVGKITPNFGCSGANLIAWLRSDSVSLVGGNVDILVDLTGKNNATATAAAQRPIFHANGGANNLPYLECGSGGIVSRMKFNTKVFSSLQAIEAYFIFNNTNDPTTQAGTDFGCLGCFGTTSNNLIPFNDHNIYDNFGRSTRITTGASTGGATSSICCYNVFSSSGSWQCRLNGTLKYQTAVNTVNIPDNCFLLANDPFNDSTSLLGKYYELRIYNGIVSANKRLQIQSELNTRYGIVFA